MRRHAAAAALVAAVLAALAAALPAAAPAKTVRVFAVGPRFDPSWVQTRETYRDKLVGMVRADVTPHRVGGGRDLITLPEDVGLLAAFSGQRGTEARAAGDLASAIVALLGRYAPVTAYYGERFPELTRRPLPARQLVVALTDTFGRTAVETFAAIADANDAYLVAGVNMAREWRIVCADRATYQSPPGGEPCAVENPARVEVLRAPDEPGRDYAYEATTPDAVNMALVFGPDGRIVSRQVKTYLTPLELPGQLDLVPGRVSGLARVDTRAGRLGIVTSKDAWMPDVLGRLDASGVDLLVQPELFVGDTVRSTGMWAPDLIKASGYSALLRAPSFDALALPSLTGNVFDFSADSQSHIAVKPRPGGTPTGRLVGQDPAPGFAAVAPWVVADPPGEPILERRRALAVVGEQLLPLPANPPCPTPAPGPCRGGQVEATIRADVEVSPRRPLRRSRPVATRPFGVARPLAPSAREQRNVQLTTRGAGVWAAFEEGGSVRVAHSDDRGRRWHPEVRLGPGRWPAIAVGGNGRIWVAWQQGPLVVLASSSDGGATFSRARPISRADAAQWKPAIAATGRRTALVAWVDERGRQAEGELPRASVYAARLAGGRIGRAREVDTAGPASDLARQLDNDWAPAVAARGQTAVVAWTDFRTYDWRIVARRSRDGGRRFGPITTVTDAPVDLESLADAPSAAVGPDGAVVTWSDFRAGTTIDPHPLYDVRIARVGDRNRRVDGHGDAQVSSFAPSLALARGGRPLVVWQDHAGGVGRILAAGRGRRGRGVVIARSPANQWRPALARSGGVGVVAWEDERDGPRQIYVARTKRLAALG